MPIAIVPVRVPEGAEPGSEITVTLPSGTLAALKVPEGAGPGSTIWAQDPNFVPVSEAWHQGMPNAPEGGWSTGLFDCFDGLSSCCMATFCSCIPLGQVAGKLELFRGAFFVCVIMGIVKFLVKFVLGSVEVDDEDPAPQQIIVSLVDSILSLAFVLVLIWARYKVAMLYKIRVNQFYNCLASTFCFCCSTLQVARHLFGWKSGVGGGCEFTSKPESRWPAPSSATLSSSPSDQPAVSQGIQERRLIVDPVPAVATLTHPLPYVPPEEVYSYAYDEEAAPSAPLLGTLRDGDLRRS